MRKLIPGEATTLTKPGAGGGFTETMSFLFRGGDQVVVTDALFHHHGVAEYAWSTMSSGVATREEARKAWKHAIARGYVATGLTNLA